MCTALTLVWFPVLVSLPTEPNAQARQVTGDLTKAYVTVTLAVAKKTSLSMY